MMYLTTYGSSELIKYNNSLIKDDEIDSWADNLSFSSSESLFQMGTRRHDNISRDILI